MQSNLSFRKLYRPAFLGASLLFFHASSPAQQPAAASGTIPDAQIEANVLKALAGAQSLSDQNITTTTVYGVVTLSGSVRDEPTRSLAETLASRAPGVKKIVDELTLGIASTSSAMPQNPDEATNPNLQSDGTMAPSPQQDQQPYPQQQSPPQQNQAQAPLARHAPPPPPDDGSYGNPSPNYPQGQPPYGAQQAGIPVTIPNGSMIRIRINEGLDSNHVQPGSVFDGTVLNDVVADGAIAVPRGAAVQGTVVDTKSAGSLKGRGAIVLQLTQVTLGGHVFPIVSNQWSSVGPDKTGRTVGSAVGLGAMGALIGAVAGGGPGAAIGAGVGGVAGLGASAASGGGQAYVPSEAILTFHLAQPAQVATVSQAEMDRLGYGVPAGAQQRPLMRRVRPMPAYYGNYGPGYYPRPYPAYYPYPY
ncbi:MAG: hypothetical protein JWM43_2634 [Acidobacteriaceae bacterium]|nr:hypothetical protein [Acidobacteriaceae bacterium]